MNKHSIRAAAPKTTQLSEKKQQQNKHHNIRKISATGLSTKSEQLLKKYKLPLKFIIHNHIYLSPFLAIKGAKPSNDALGAINQTQANQ